MKSDFKLFPIRSFSANPSARNLPKRAIEWADNIKSEETGLQKAKRVNALRWNGKRVIVEQPILNTLKRGKKTTAQVNNGVSKAVYECLKNYDEYHEQLFGEFKKLCQEFNNEANNLRVELANLKQEQSYLKQKLTVCAELEVTELASQLQTQKQSLESTFATVIAKLQNTQK